MVIKMEETVEQKIQQCLSYLLEHKILCKLLDGYVEKYRSFGMACGNVILSNLKEEDIEVLEGFFGKSFHGKKKTSISATTMIKAIENSCYAGCDLNDLVCAYEKDHLLSKKEMKEVYLLEQKQFFENILEGYQDMLFYRWLRTVLENKEAPYTYLIKQYNSNKETLKNQCDMIAKALCNLPVEQDRYEYLAIFATKITGNPHGFDEGSEHVLLLRYGIAFYLEEKHKDKKEHKGKVRFVTAEEKQELFFRVGILKDDISNQVLLYRMQAEKKDGMIHAGIQGFFQEREPVTVSLLTITKLGKCMVDGNIMYVVENPIVFARIIEKIKNAVEEKSTEEIDTHTLVKGKEMISARCGALCVNGQPNLATLAMMDKLAHNHTIFYYAGDFDPEGLLIAQRLKLRYGKQLKFWHYSTKEYEKSKSQKVVDSTRMKMLDKLEEPELIAIAECIKRNGVAGYQESLMEEYLLT